MRGQIAAFAQDGNRIAWVSSSSGCRGVVQMRDLANSKQWGLATKRGATCRNRARMDASPMLALAGTRAVWGLYQKSNTFQLVTVIAGGVGQRDRAVAALESERRPGAPTVTVAGDAPTLAYLWGGVNQIVGRRAVQVPGAHPRAFLDASGPTVAFARYLGTDSTSDVSWSPNGATLAFTSGHEYGEPSLYLSSPTGKRMASLTGASNVVGPTWSPTGAALAYIAEGRANWGLWTVNPTTKARKLLAADVDPGTTPAWSPNGYVLAFASGNGVYAVATGGGSARRLADGSDSSWSPDGAKLVFSGPTGVSTVNADGTGKVVLTTGRSPRFSPDGTRIAFERNGDIWVMNADGRGQRQLTSDGKDILPLWSPGGTLIAFERGDPDRPYVVDVYGGGVRKLSTTPVQGGLGWSPDAARVVFASKGGLYIAQAAGSGVRRIAISPRTRIELRHARSGRLEKAIAAAGQAQAIGLSKSILAVLTGRRLSIYRRASGVRLAAVRVPRDVAPELSAAGRTVVFRARRTIWLVSGRRLRRLAVAQSTPVGLSIEGRRVAWAENVGGRGRIRAVTLP